MDWLEIILGGLTLFFGLYYWSTSTFDFWRSCGVKGPRPLPLIGNAKDVLIGKTSFGEYLKSQYEEYRDERMIGVFSMREPRLMLIDLELIKDVLIKDFTKFPYRGWKVFNKAEPLSQHMINLEATRARPLRTKMSPLFTSGKLKNMFYLLIECGDHLESYLDKLIDGNDEVIIEVCELTAKFTTDVIGNCAFGLATNALTDNDCELRKMGRHIFSPGWTKIFKFWLRETVPRLYTLIGPLMTDWKTTNFFVNIMKDTMAHRKESKIVRHDFIDLLMELKDHPDQVAGDIELTDTLLTSQLFVFFLAGFETSSTTMSHVLYELALHQSIQDKLRVEINNELAKANGEITYEGIKSMKYLEMVLREGLRKYPPATALFRKSTEKYTFAGTNLTIPEGTRVVIPAFAIHRDPKIYPEPEVFDPERWTEEAVKARHPMSWLAFGQGPRKCIAGRFAYFQSKLGLIRILQRYKVEVCEKTQIPYIIGPRHVTLGPIDGIHVKISRIDEKFSNN